MVWRARTGSFSDVNAFITSIKRAVNKKKAAKPVATAIPVKTASPAKAAASARPTHQNIPRSDAKRTAWARVRTWSLR